MTKNKSDTFEVESSGDEFAVVNTRTGQIDSFYSTKEAATEWAKKRTARAAAVASDEDSTPRPGFAIDGVAYRKQREIDRENGIWIMGEVRQP